MHVPPPPTAAHARLTSNDGVRILLVEDIEVVRQVDDLFVSVVKLPNRR